MPVKRLLLLIIGTALFLGIISCAPGSASPITTTPAQLPASTGKPGQQLFEVTNKVFFDYDGNGIKEGIEPAIPNIELTYQPGDISCVTDKNGLGTVKIPAGSYTVSINDSSNQFKFILNSQSKFSDIKDGLKTNISKNQEISIPLAQGFLTWPFRSNVVPGIIYFFEPEDPTLDPLTMCNEGTWAVEKYSGLYIDNIKAGTELIAPAPLTITDYIPRKGNTGGVVVVSYGNNYSGYYIYAKLLKGEKIGDTFPRGKVFATTELCDGGATHIHLFLLESSSVVDPYDYFTEYRTPNYPS
jgi:hypothetical protein